MAVHYRRQTWKSSAIAKADLALEKAYLVYPGELSFPLRDGMEALGYAKIPDFGSHSQPLFAKPSPHGSSTAALPAI